MLAEHGALVTAMRHAFVRGHAERFSQLADAIGEQQPVTMRYTVSSLSGQTVGAQSVGAQSVGGPSIGAQDVETADAVPALAARFRAAFTQAMEQQRPNEMRRGMTLVGPHRDELALLLGGRELRTFGSAGQQRSAAIALRLLELATLRDAIGGTPLLLLDDPFAELDLRRAGRVLSLLEDSGVDQVLLAVPRVEDIPEAFTRLERRTMRDGVLT
jgi:DNA replication and repair protein RecF